MKPPPSIHDQKPGTRPPRNLNKFSIDVRQTTTKEWRAELPLPGRPTIWAIGQTLSDAVKHLGRQIEFAANADAVEQWAKPKGDPKPKP